MLHLILKFPNFSYFLFPNSLQYIITITNQTDENDYLIIYLILYCLRQNKLLPNEVDSSFVEDAQQLSSLVSGTPELHSLLLQLNTEDYKSTQNLQKVNNLLQNIRDQFNLNIQTLQAGFTAAQQQAQALFELLNAKIDSLVKDVIPQLQQDIQGKESEIDSRRSLANESQANLDATRESLRQSIQEKGLAPNSHNILISEYHSNLDTVAECISALHESGIKRQ